MKKLIFTYLKLNRTIFNTAKPLLAFALFLFSLQAFSQEAPFARATLDTTTIVIGQQAKMTVEVTAKNHEKLIWPQIPNKLADGVEVVSHSLIDTIAENGQEIYRQTLAVTAFDSGFYALEPLSFAYYFDDDTMRRFVQTSSIWLEVSTVAVDTTQMFHDIKPVMAAPLTWREILTYVGIGLGSLVVLAAIVILIIWLIRKYRKQETGFTLLPPKPKLPPHVIALEQLETLRLKKLWQADKIKEYYSELTDIVREYIEARFGVQAVEMTTDEILYNLKNAGINPQAMGKLSGTLQTADLVKFAKASPLPLENDSVLIYSVDFVKETQAQAEPDKPAPIYQDESSDQTVAVPEDTESNHEEPKNVIQ